MEPILEGLSAANPGYLLALAKLIANQSIAHNVEETVIFKKSNSRKVIVILPGSFLNVRYLSELAAGMEGLDADIIGVNYPGRSEETKISNVDTLHLVDYATAVYAFLLSLKPTYDEVGLIGHSLGTILVQLSVFLHYFFSSSGQDDLAIPLRKIAILGGGVPRLGLMDYAATLLARSHTMSTIMQMVNNPERFISPKGDMRKILGSDALYEDLIRRKLIFVESKPLLKQAFFKADYAFIPAKIMTDMNIKGLFVYAVDDFFVTQYSSRKAVRQWAAVPHVLSVGHSGMVLGSEGRKLGAACADFFKSDTSP